MFDTAIAISHIDTPTTLDDAEAVDLIRTIGSERIIDVYKRQGSDRHCDYRNGQEHLEKPFINKS